ncbi:flagella basal body P-ring formation protein FlgA [Paucimonas lemoignei]|uniref:Flagella basal body P-ring formation protein FlgA n=1 Tax=Paucimonas lemoignei TaxID=29443 RepID=A0A4R3I2Z1_PAULE|nr:flagellar basal body P-ring formation chaperone FlgA [Paucimonas lemoignei]TCS39161.1 flagella basal body P-ring formation protein FlgA [Paucimonas lemoignei]
MHLLSKALLFIALMQLAIAAAAQQAAPQRQDPEAIRKVVEHFLKVQSTGLPGQVSISANALDPRSNLIACAAPEAFMPPGSRVWGRTTVGVRCTVPVSWTVYIPATVKVVADYLTTSAPLAQGQVIGPQHLTRARGDLTHLPAGILTDPSQALGRTLAMSLPAGTPLRNDALRAQAAVQQGQTVRLQTVGTGFRISAEAKALNNAGEGQVVQARTSNGQIVSGVARIGGVVEVTY